MHADCHIHMILDGVYWKDAITRHSGGVQKADVQRILRQYQSLGFSYLRDGGDNWGVGEYASRIAADYGITYKTPCYPIHKKGCYGGFIGRGFETMREYRDLVHGVKRRGGHFIKIMISGLMDFDHYGVVTSKTLEKEEIVQMIHIAHDEGFSVMAHANTDAAVSAAIEAGVDSFEHGAYLSEETLCQLSESDTVWVPTLVTIANLIGCGRFPDAVLERLLAYQMQAVKTAGEKGALLAPGSDAGAYCVMHGQGGLDEYRLFTEIFAEQTDEILEKGIKKIVEKF